MTRRGRSPALSLAIVGYVPSRAYFLWPLFSPCTPHVPIAAVKVSHGSHCYVVGGIENSTGLCLNRLRHEKPNGASDLFRSIDDVVLLLCPFAYEGTPISRHRESAPRRA